MMAYSVELDRAGNGFRTAQQYDEAERAFHELVNENSQSPSSYVGLAKVTDRQQRFDDIP